MRSAIILQTINHQEGNLGGKQNILLCMMSSSIYLLKIPNTTNQSITSIRYYHYLCHYSEVSKISVKICVDSRQAVSSFHWISVRSSLFILVDFSKIETRVFPGMAIIAVAEAAWMSS